MSCERANKRRRYNDEKQTTTITHLGQDEVSIILSYLPISGKLMFACSSKLIYQLVDNYVRKEQFPAYDSCNSLSQIWCKYNVYKIESIDKNELQLKLNNMKKILERTGSFSSVTKALSIQCLKHVLDVQQLIEIFSIPTGRDTTVQIYNKREQSSTVPEIIGHTLKHFTLTCIAPLDFELLNPICNIESLKIDLISTDTYNLVEVPSIDQLCVLSQLKCLEFNCENLEYESDLYLYFCKLFPNLEILKITTSRDNFPLIFSKYCHKITEIYVDPDDYGSILSDKDVLRILQYFKELKVLSIKSGCFQGRAFKRIGKYAIRTICMD
jgi:hypothetical protein